jgi:hypothetical protein
LGAARDMAGPPRGLVSGGCSRVGAAAGLGAVLGAGSVAAANELLTRSRGRATSDCREAWPGRRPRRSRGTRRHDLSPDAMAVTCLLIRGSQVRVLPGGRP